MVNLWKGRKDKSKCHKLNQLRKANSEVNCTSVHKKAKTGASWLARLYSYYVANKLHSCFPQCQPSQGSNVLKMWTTVSMDLEKEQKDDLGQIQFKIILDKGVWQIYIFFFRLKDMTTNYQALTPTRHDIRNFIISTSHNNPAKEQISNSSWLPCILLKIVEDLENFCFFEFCLSIFTMLYIYHIRS